MSRFHPLLNLFAESGCKKNGMQRVEIYLFVVLDPVPLH